MRLIARIRPDGEFLCCVDCAATTTRLEASRRRFNENRCARCNGRLERFKALPEREATR